MVPRDFFVDLGVIHMSTDFYPSTLKWALGLQLIEQLYSLHSGQKVQILSYKICTFAGGGKRWFCKSELPVGDCQSKSIYKDLITD